MAILTFWQPVFYQELCWKCWSGWMTASKKPPWMLLEGHHRSLWYLGMFIHKRKCPTLNKRPLPDRATQGSIQWKGSCPGSERSRPAQSQQPCDITKSFSADLWTPGPLDRRQAAKGAHPPTPRLQMTKIFNPFSHKRLDAGLNLSFGVGLCGLLFQFLGN